MQYRRALGIVAQLALDRFHLAPDPPYPVQQFPFFIGCV
jgi:hypothetical protein